MENGCVEAVTKIGARFNPFLADELNKGVVNVDTLVSDAGDAVIPFDPANVQAGDVIVYGDNDHVVLADGNVGKGETMAYADKVLDGAGDVSSAPAKSLSLDDFGNVLTSKALDFAGTNDDTVRKIYHDMAVGDNDEAVAALFAPYMQDGVFQNTADVRMTLAQNDAFRYQERQARALDELKQEIRSALPGARCPGRG